MRDPDKGGIMAVVSVDRGPPFGLRVVLSRAGKNVRAGVTGHNGQYEFVNLAPGAYDVDFYYGDHFVERKKVIVAAGEHWTSVHGELRVTAFPRIPECA